MYPAARVTRLLLEQTSTGWIDVEKEDIGEASTPQEILELQQLGNIIGPKLTGLDG